MNALIAPEHIWIEGGLRTGLAVEMAAGRVARIRPLAEGEVPTSRPHLMMPACTDLQVNGSGGVMLNDGPSPETIARIIAAQRARGTGWVLPTLITSAPAQIAAAADAVIEAWGLPGLAGLHLEGPHINVERKGTHDPRHIRPMDEATLAALERLRAAGIPVMLTLAPEIVPPGTIARIAEMGVIVSAGHTAASPAQAKAGLSAGVSCFTHLFNAMPPMTSRAPGVVATAINSEAYCGIIADGIHVDWAMLALACAARPVPGRMFLVSDAMATVGGPDHFTLYGERIELRGGALVNAAGALAGAHIDMLASLGNMVRHAGLPLEAAVAMACDNPNRAMGLTPPAIEPGRALDELVMLDAALERTG
ncbi:N-acetylglucosamine-6-phosphate deacetylase [Aureimonas populi]|uniref:N-acetylglucosamine-6-phosphate deacetylase n=1 Tax=Aureimonas populi TaxID=1701758 RepID=A0ABW5CL25_9HYPH|nr:N-acetylglucosamine-6-phosphate deacetylase [Aureimonas populi]